MIQDDLITRKLTIVKGQDGKLRVDKSNVPSYPAGAEITESQLPSLLREGINYTFETKASPSLLLG